MAAEVATAGLCGGAAARLALAAGKPALLWARRIADTETPVSAALKLFERERGDWILESVEGGETRGRYSLIGLAPDLVFRSFGARCAINPHWATDQAAFADCAGDTMAQLRQLVQRCRIAAAVRQPGNWANRACRRRSGSLKRRLVRAAA